MFSIVTRLLRRRSQPRDSRSPALVREYIRRADYRAAHAMLDAWPLDTPTRQAEVHALRGELLFHQRDDAPAQAEFQAALQIDPGHAEAHYGLSLLLADPAVAAGHAQFAVNRIPGEPRFLAQLGFLHLQLGTPMAAEGPLVAATTLDPHNAHAWNNLGLVRRIRGQSEGARGCFEAALRADPGHAQARENLDELVRDSEAVAQDPAAPAAAPTSAADLDQEIDRLEAALGDEPSNPQLAIDLAQAYQGLDDVPSAFDILEQALARQPDEPQLHGALGMLLTRTRDFDRAAGHLERAIEAEPDHRDWLLQLAACHSGRNLHSAAWSILDRAARVYPNDDALQIQLVSALTNLCRYEEAQAIAERLAERDIHVPTSGMILVFLGRNQEAEAWLEKQLESQPNEPGRRFLRAQVRLSQQDFARGWDDYRFRQLGDSKNLRVLPFPIWCGEPITGKRMIVLAEQGLGDQIMFASCLPDLIAQQPAELIVEAHHRIAPTLARSFPSCRVIPTTQNKSLEWVKDCGAVDYYLPLADLPSHYRRSVAEFPPHCGYLQAHPTRRAHWEAAITSATQATCPDSKRRPRIGLSWRGGTESTRSFIRCVDPAWMAALGRSFDADWVCLQYGDVREELATARANGMPELIHWPESIADLDEFAALVSGLDLVITVCNTTVHYAGALGVPVWVLAPKVPEWRYGLDNEVLPWYPSSRMFRQTALNDWPATLQRVETALLAWAASRTVDPASAHDLLAPDAARHSTHTTE